MARFLTLPVRSPPARIRKEAEKVKGGEDRIDEIIAAKLRDLNIEDSANILKIPEHCVVNSKVSRTSRAAMCTWRLVPP